MSYIDAIKDTSAERIYVVERAGDSRVYKDFPIDYSYYYSDPRGKHLSIYGQPVSKAVCKNSKEFMHSVRTHKATDLFESDLNPIFKCLATNYLGIDSPKLHTAFFDIEVDFNPIKGFANPSDPFNMVTAITMYLNWSHQLITLSIPPKSMTIEEAEKALDGRPNCFFFETEKEMLDVFLDMIEDADVLSGWNSEGYDIPYLVNRVTRVLSKDDTRRFCLWNQYPKARTYFKFGAEAVTFDLVGRVHMDYMQLYIKYNYNVMHSYSLDAICEHELNERKLPYEGTLDQLYNNDYVKFIDYNRQDTLLLHKLNEKLKFLDLANELAHQTGVQLQTTMGVVATTDQAIINRAHELGFVVPNRVRTEKVIELDPDELPPGAAGAYVAVPKKGLHENIGSIDIKSLYPSAIRALNMSPECIIGQLRPTYTEPYIKSRMAKKMTFAEAWDGLFGSLEYQYVIDRDKSIDITVDWANGESSEHSAAEVWNAIFDSNVPWVLSANGTIFSVEKKGLIPGLLESWYADRKSLQAKLKESIDKKESDMIEFWDKRQLVKKIQLNSAYGAILNPGSRFNDLRIGQSTTLTGRVITRHMSSFVNETITGKYDHTGESIIYGDTDSVYFTAHKFVGDNQLSIDDYISLYDTIADRVNDSFPDCMYNSFHCPAENGSIISGSRELVGSAGLFVSKKRYGILIIDQDGKRLDVDGKAGKVKAMGLEIKRSDTPKNVQDFLSEILFTVLTSRSREKVIEQILEFKHKFRALHPWQKGTPRRANNVTHYTTVAESKKKGVTIPGHVRASINWNRLRDMYGDNYSMRIMDGQKVIVCSLKQNVLNYTSVAYPVDEQKIPKWFRELPFDELDMEHTVVTKKISNLLGVLNWDLDRETNIVTGATSLFDFV